MTPVPPTKVPKSHRGVRVLTGQNLDRIPRRAWTAEFGDRADVILF